MFQPTRFRKRGTASEEVALRLLTAEILYHEFLFLSRDFLKFITIFFFASREAAIGGAPTVDVSRLGSRAYARDSLLCGLL